MLTIIAAIVLLIGQDPAIAKAEKVLVEHPDDPAANQTLAMHFAETQEWDRAIPFFAKAKISELRTAAAAEAKSDGNKFTFIEIGDAWAAAIQKAPGARQACLDRASFWYAQGWPTLDKPWKDRLRMKLNRLYAPVVAGRTGDLPRGWSGPVDGKSKAEVQSTIVHSGCSAIRLTPPGNGGISSVLHSPAIPVTPGAKLEVSAWILTDGTDHPAEGFVANITGLKGGIASMSLGWSADLPVWVRVTQTMVVPDGARAVTLDFPIGSTKGTILVDDVSIRVDGKEVLTGGGFEK